MKDIEKKVFTDHVNKLAVIRKCIICDHDDIGLIDKCFICTHKDPSQAYVTYNMHCERCGFIYSFLASKVEG